ncbi:MAG: MBL fold metallo-hydrolase, partial [Calditrichaeota bacterium]
MNPNFSKSGSIAGPIKFTILCENRVVNPKLIAEQGLAILVETKDNAVLFDTGQTDTVLHNAEQLGIDLSRLNAVVLSHGHFDMTGGLFHIIKKIGNRRVVCHPNIFNKKYKIINRERMEIGITWERTELEDLGANFILKTRPMEVVPGVWTSGEIPRLSGYEYIDETYQERVLESYIHDELHDDLSLIVKSEKGLIVLMGCGHSGPVNTLKHAMRITGMNRIHAIMGGMHLHQAPDDKIFMIINNLIALNPDYVIPLHCCGFRAINQLFNRVRDKVL